MHFHLTEEQLAIQDAVRGTLAENWPIDRLHGFADSDEDFDQQSWDALMALGVGGLAVGEPSGGAGLGLLDAALVLEIAGEAAATGPLIGQILTAIALDASENPAAKPHLEKLISGAAVATIAFDGTSLVQAAGSADLFLTGRRDGALMLVEAAESIAIEQVRSSDRSRPLGRVDLSGSAGIELFAAHDPMVARIHDAALILLAADALGGAQKVTDMSVAYAKEREQFGQPIGRFQGLKHQLAHMALDVEPARALLWYAAYAWDAGLVDAPRAAAMAKAHLADVYVRATRAAVAAHGGIGYTWEYGLNYWFRRALFDRAYLGSPAVHRSRAADMAGW